VIPAVLAATPDVRSWSDVRLLERQRELAAERRRVDAEAAVVAREIGRRSDRTHGSQGLAIREGARSTEDLLERLTGESARQVRALIDVGTMLDSTPDDDEAPWLAPVTAAVEAGELGIESASAIRAGIGKPDASVGSADLQDAAARLVEDARSMGADKIAARARMERDALDLAGVAARESERRGRRFLRLYPQADGMTKIVGLLDPESAALVTDAFDRVTSPRRHGPRFVDPRERAREERIVADPRTTEQLVHDAFVEMVSVAIKADDRVIFGVKAPAVRVHVRGEALARREGKGRIEGQADAVSIQTVERHACEAGLVPVGFDTDGQVVNVGREQRLFTRRQRIGLAARDGGCRFPGCDRPASWTEAHHIDEFARDEGRTDIADGVLLCRFHHMYVHNDGWRIIRRGAEYFAVPPDRPGRAREPIPMPSKMRV
jgi:hypothetical protein